MNEPTSKNDPADTESSKRGSTGAASKAATAVLWLGSTTVLWQAVSWITTLLTARILNPTDYGLIAMAETVIPYLALIGAFNLGTWMVQTRRLGEEEHRVMFSLSLLASTGMTALAICVAPLVAGFYDNDALTRPFQLMSTIFIFRGLATVPQAKLERAIDFRSISIMNLVLGISRGVLQLTLAYLGYGYWALVVGVVCFEAARTLWLVSVAGLPRGFGWNSKMVGQAIRFGGAVTGAAFLWVLFSSADKVVVGKFFSVELLGFYSMAFFLTDLPMSKIAAVIRPVLLPLFSRMRDQRENLNRTFLRIIRGICGVTFPILAGMFVVAEESVAVLLGEKWAALVLPLQVMCFVGIMQAFTTNIEPLLQALGKPGKILVFNAIRALVMPLAFIGLGIKFGIEGVYAAWLLVFPWTSFYILRALNQVAGITPGRYIANLRAPLLASIGMAAGTHTLFAWLASQGLALSMLGAFAAKAAVGVMLYAGLLFLLFPKDSREIWFALKELRD